MKMPGFNAEASLYRKSGGYRLVSNQEHLPKIGQIIPGLNNMFTVDEGSKDGGWGTAAGDISVSMGGVTIKAPIGWWERLPDAVDRWTGRQTCTNYCLIKGMGGTEECHNACAEVFR